MDSAVVLNPTRLIIAAIIGLALLLLLIIKFKIHAMLSILIGAVTIGMIAGMPFSDIVTAVDDGIGNRFSTYFLFTLSKLTAPLSEFVIYAILFGS